MELIRQPNRWSCNACAWAMVLGLTLEEIVQALGHDGTAVDLDEDEFGFHDEELLWLAVARGWACTRLEIPESDADSWYYARVRLLMNGRSGVLSVTHPEIPDGLHAVAWDGLHVYDPLLGHRPLSEYILHGFIWIEQIERRVA